MRRRAQLPHVEGLEHDSIPVRVDRNAIARSARRPTTCTRAPASCKNILHNTPRSENGRAKQACIASATHCTHAAMAVFSTALSCGSVTPPIVKFENAISSTTAWST